MPTSNSIASSIAVRVCRHSLSVRVCNRLSSIYVWLQDQVKQANAVDDFRSERKRFCETEKHKQALSYSQCCRCLCVTSLCFSLLHTQHFILHSNGHLPNVIMLFLVCVYNPLLPLLFHRMEMQTLCFLIAFDLGPETLVCGLKLWLHLLQLQERRMNWLKLCWIIWSMQRDRRLIHWLLLGWSD